MNYYQSLAAIGVAAFAVSGQSNAQTAPAPSTMKPLLVQDYALLEEAPSGVYREPEWVRQRRFSTTRIYIQKNPWEMGAEQWHRTRFYDDGRVTQRSVTEFEIGLPYRMQLDLYQKMIHDNADNEGWKQDEVAVELRYAFADWGVIPMNPTVYVEYAFAHEGPDVLEAKLLLGEDVNNGWHWGVNLIVEQELWGEEATEIAVSGGLSKTIIDNVLSVGVEGRWGKTEDEKAEAIFGPSIQWLPTDNTHLDLVAMGGLTNSAPNAECWLIFGFDFGPGTKVKKGYKPTTVGGL